ncbi:MAG TPA: TMEM165/GDT1 family protein [Myxococcota bacterium]|jgi:putative Ca2+/H+ antiporter (TMEM165/GDT1 family)
MDLRLFFTIFASVFVAELGDKTQLATLLFASDREVSKLTVFAASASALVLSSALGVLAGGVVGEYVSPRVLRWVAGGGFIAVGLWVLLARGE